MPCLTWPKSTYTEVLQVIDGHSVTEEVEQSILQHATVTVAIQCKLVDNSGISATGLSPSCGCTPSLQTRATEEWNIRKNESVPVSPARVLGVEVHELVEQDVGHRGHTHRGTGVTGVSLGGGIDLMGQCQSIVLDLRY